MTTATETPARRRDLTLPQQVVLRKIHYSLPLHQDTRTHDLTVRRRLINLGLVEAGSEPVLAGSEDTDWVPVLTGGWRKQWLPTDEAAAWFGYGPRPGDRVRIVDGYPEHVGREGYVTDPPYFKNGARYPVHIDDGSPGWTELGIYSAELVLLQRPVKEA